MPLRAMIVDPSWRRHENEEGVTYHGKTYNTQGTSQPAKKGEFLVQEEGRENSTDDDRKSSQGRLHSSES